MEIEKPEKAIENYKKVIELGPKTKVNHNGRKISFIAVAHYNLGISFMTLGKFDEAIIFFTNALKTEPDFYEVYNDRGLAKVFIRDHDDAIKDLEKACEISDDEILQQNLQSIKDKIIYLDKIKEKFDEMNIIFIDNDNAEITEYIINELAEEAVIESILKNSKKFIVSAKDLISSEDYFELEFDNYEVKLIQHHK